jgi:hypothetical protein
MFKVLVTLKIIIFKTLFLCNKIMLKTYKNDRDIVKILISMTVMPSVDIKLSKTKFMYSTTDGSTVRVKLLLNTQFHHYNLKSFMIKLIN